MSDNKSARDKKIYPLDVLKRHLDTPQLLPHENAKEFIQLFDRLPWVSVTMWRLRPLIFFPASKPLGPPLSVVFTDWLSITPAVGLASPKMNRD
jgi:hypothetical protein